jgi:alpha-tubulin suppressor-like RCC1 family protein
VAQYSLNYLIFEFGQLGLGDTSNRLIPTLITTLFNIVQVTTGNAHTICLSSNGQVYSFGFNSVFKILCLIIRMDSWDLEIVLREFLLY